MKCGILFCWSVGILFTFSFSTVRHQVILPGKNKQANKSLGIITENTYFYVFLFSISQIWRFVNRMLPPARLFYRNPDETYSNIRHRSENIPGFGKTIRCAGIPASPARREGRFSNPFCTFARIYRYAALKTNKERQGIGRSGRIPTSHRFHRKVPPLCNSRGGISL